MYEPIQNSSRLNGHINQFPYRGLKILGATIPNLVGRDLCTSRWKVLAFIMKAWICVFGGNHRKKKKECVVSCMSFSYCISCCFMPACVKRSAASQQASKKYNACSGAFVRSVSSDFSLRRPDCFFLRYIGITKVGVCVCLCMCVCACACASRNSVGLEVKSLEILAVVLVWLWDVPYEICSKSVQGCRVGPQGPYPVEWCVEV